MIGRGPWRSALPDSRGHDAIKTEDAERAGFQVTQTSCLRRRESTPWLRKQ